MLIHYIFHTYIIVRLSLYISCVSFLIICVLTALQSPIEYQKEKGGSHSLTRNSSASRPSQQPGRPSSTTSIGVEKPPLSGRTPTSLKMSTSNGSSCFDPQKHSESTKVNSRLKNGFPEPRLKSSQGLIKTHTVKTLSDSA